MMIAIHATTKSQNVTAAELRRYLRLHPQFSLSSIRRALRKVMKEHGAVNPATVDHYLKPGHHGGLGYGRRIARMLFRHLADGLYSSEAREYDDPHYRIVNMGIKPLTWRAVYVVPGGNPNDLWGAESLGNFGTTEAAKFACARHAELLADACLHC